jgi:hypothetical protein
MRTATLFAFLTSILSLQAQIDTPIIKKDTILKVPKPIISDTPGYVADTSSMLDDLFDEMDSGPDFEQNTFKGTRIINAHNTEMIGKQNLDFRICHRFGEVNQGSYNLWGLDQAFQRMSFTYGIVDNLNVEIGRSNVRKVYDASIKWRIMRQAKGDKKRPMSIALLSNIAVQTEKNTNPQYIPYYFSHRLFYTHQVLIARKFSNGFSLQIMPTLVHRNLVDSQIYKNDVVAIGIGGRNKITRKTAITYEYFYVLPNQIKSIYYNSLSVGFDIETGGHVFQLQLTNSRMMNEKGFIAETEGNWLKGGVHFGFNISRVFYIGRH